jgi:hypothetical protein
VRQELRESVSDLIYDRIDRDEFVRRTGIDPRREKNVIGRELHSALDAGSADDLHSALTLGSMFDAITPELAPPLAGLLTEHWHVCHEDIARMLPHLRAPETVETLARAAAIGSTIWSTTTAMRLRASAAGRLPT